MRGPKPTNISHNKPFQLIPNLGLGQIAMVAMDTIDPVEALEEVGGPKPTHISLEEPF